MAANHTHNQNSQRRKKNRRKRRIRAALTLALTVAVVLGVAFAGGWILRKILWDQPNPGLITASKAPGTDKNNLETNKVSSNTGDLPDTGETASTEAQADNVLPDDSGLYGGGTGSVTDHSLSGETGTLDTDRPSSDPLAENTDTWTSSLDLTNLHSHHVLLADASTGETLAEYNGEDRIYPASMTKVMTAYLAVLYISDWDATMTVPADIFDTLYARDASLAGFAPGETATFRDLLYGVLLPSGAECCEALARWISGSEDAFVELMNQKASELGMTHTHFCNPTGLHDDDHYTTAPDLVILLREALKYQSFRDAFTAERWSTKPTDQHPDGFTFHSTLFRFLDTASVTGGSILGGKTGYTDEAGQCLISLATINGRDYILVTALAFGGESGEQCHILDAVNVYNQIGSLT